MKLKLVDGRWIDKNNNWWEASLFTKEQVLEYSQTLLDCIYCGNCKYCIKCDTCVECVGCIDCKGCYYCTNCIRCVSCHVRKDSTDLSHA